MSRPFRELGIGPELIWSTPQWLGDLESPYVSAMAKCISAQWHLEPLFIREGGSVPSLPFLEQEFGAVAVHLPIGTSSDNAHLPNERIRILNLEVRPLSTGTTSFMIADGWLFAHVDHSTAGQSFPSG